MSTIAGAATLMGRRHAESLMTATGVIERATGETTQDPDTLEETPVMETIYTGRCRLRITRTTSREGEIPGAVAVKDELVLSIPVEADGSENVRPNDVWTCTSNPLDPSVVGVQLRIAGVHHGTHMTSRRFPVEEVS